MILTVDEMKTAATALATEVVVLSVANHDARGPFSLALRMLGELSGQNPDKLFDTLLNLCHSSLHAFVNEVQKVKMFTPEDAMIVLRRGLHLDDNSTNSAEPTGKSPGE